jgi:NitT/TauT family transport system permease protein
MSAVEDTETAVEAPRIVAKHVILGGRIILAIALLIAWEACARSFGLLFFAPPWDVLKRIGEISLNGELVEDVIVTLRVSAVGFVIGCAGGILLPFLLDRSPRLTLAIEPYIIASMGIPKYALAPWLILWFGIGDLPKLVIVSLMVFYIVFVTTFSGIRAVDQRLVNMARIVGASETVIAR